MKFAEWPTGNSRSMYVSVSVPVGAARRYASFYDNNWFQSHKPRLAPHCRVLPPGEFNRVTSHLGDKPTGRQTTGRQTKWATVSWATIFGRLTRAGRVARILNPSIY